MAPNEQWHLSGNAAKRYERVVVRYNLGVWAPVLIEHAGLQRGERVLDIACGTGVVTRLAAQEVGAEGQVTGLDLNPGMLAVARSLPPVSGAPITWVESRAVAMDVPDAAFDLVRDAASALQPYADGDGVALSEETHIATAHT